MIKQVSNSASVSSIRDAFLSVMREKGASSTKSINLLCIGPALISDGYQEDDVYNALMGLSRSEVIVLDQDRNAVRFP